MGRLKTATFLISRGADVNARDRAAGTPLHRAAAFGRADVVAYLVAHGAIANAADVYGRTPLDLVKSSTLASPKTKGAIETALSQASIGTSQATVGTQIGKLTTIRCGTQVELHTLAGATVLGAGNIFIDLASISGDPNKFWFRAHVPSYPSLIAMLPPVCGQDQGCINSSSGTVYTLTISSEENRQLAIKVDRITSEYVAVLVEKDRRGDPEAVTRESGSCEPVNSQVKF
jgi:hypothetical protein